MSLRVRGVAAPSKPTRDDVRESIAATGDDNIALPSNLNESRSANGERSVEAGVKISGLGLLLLLIDDDELDSANPGVLSRVYDVAINEIDRQTEAEKSRRENVKDVLRILQWVDESWRPVGSLAITTTRTLDDYGDWASTAVATDEKQFERWVRANALPDDDSGVNLIGGDGAGTASAWRAAAALAGGTAALAGLGAVVARAAQKRRRARRRRADVVLDARDFTFPLDEPRRVGDGMEAMLSCWLQQLHEFGGPELERPDLLKRAPVPSTVAATSSTPAAPSSISNANHAAPDRRVRFKVSTVALRFVEASFEL